MLSLRWRTNNRGDLAMNRIVRREDWQLFGLVRPTWLVGEGKKMCGRCMKETWRNEKGECIRCKFVY